MKQLRNQRLKIAIAVEKLTLPKFDQADFIRLQNQQIEGLKLAQKDAPTIATQVFSKLVFGANNSFAHGNGGTISTVQKLNLKDVQDFYASNYGPKAADIIVVSDLNEASIKSKLSVFNNWKGGNTDEPELKQFPQLAAGTLYLIDKADAAQSEIRIGKRSRR